MAVFFRICGIVVLLTFWGGVTGGALASAPTKPKDAVVLVTSHWRGNYALSHGVAVGDGSLIVACYAGVFDLAPVGSHRLAKWVTVTSPYLGDVAEAEMVVAEASQHLVLLRVPWRGHPSLNVADTLFWSTVWGSENVRENEPYERSIRW